MAVMVAAMMLYTGAASFFDVCNRKNKEQGIDAIVDKQADRERPWQ